MNHYNLLLTTVITSYFITTVKSVGNHVKIMKKVNIQQNLDQYFKKKWSDSYSVFFNFLFQIGAEERVLTGNTFNRQ